MNFPEEAYKLSLEEEGEYELLVFEDVGGFLVNFGAVEVTREEDVDDEVDKIVIDISDDEKTLLKNAKSKGELPAS